MTGPSAWGSSFLWSWASEDDRTITLGMVGLEGGGGIKSSIGSMVRSSRHEMVKVACQP